MTMTFVPERRCRSSIFRCTPRYRLLRAIRIASFHAFKHRRLSSLIHGQWLCTRARSSWSRA